MPKASRSRIAQGQPARDPEATRAQILDAAEEEFARYGLAGARIDAIAAQTGVTKAMIYYYFGSKEGVYEAVLERILTVWKGMLQEIGLDQLSPEAALRKGIHYQVKDMVERPQRVMILFHESVQNQGHYYRKHNFHLLWSSIMGILEAGVQEGVFRQMDPFLAANHIMGTFEMYFLFIGCTQHIRPDEDLLSPEVIERHTEQATEMILAGIRATPAV